MSRRDKTKRMYFAGAFLCLIVTIVLIDVLSAEKAEQSYVMRMRTSLADTPNLACPSQSVQPKIAEIGRIANASHAFGINQGTSGACRHFCARLAMHRRGKDLMNKVTAVHNESTFAEWRAALIDTRIWRCDDINYSLDKLLQHGCDCTDTDHLIATDVPSGLDFGSVQLWELLRRFSRQHAYIMQWFHRKYEQGINEPPPGGVQSDSPYGCPIETPQQPRLAIFRCFRGGAADQVKGLLQALMLTLLSPQPHAFVFDCRLTLPIQTAWIPHAAGGININWTIPTWLERHLAISDLPQQFPIANNAIKSYEWLDHTSQFKGINDFLDPNNAVEVKVIYGNAYFGRYFRNAVLSDNLLYRMTKSAEIHAACGLPPEIVTFASGVNSPYMEKLVQLLNADDMLTAPQTVTTTTGMYVQNAVAVKSEFQCSAYRINLPTVIAARPGLAAGSANIAAQLIEWLVRPTAAVAAKLQEIAPKFDPQSQLVLSVHVRVGTPPSGAMYNDPPRDPSEKAAAAVLTCAPRTVLQSLHFMGKKPKLLVYVSTDNREAFTSLSARFPPTFFGMEVSVVELPTSAVTVHVGNTDVNVPLAHRRDGFIVAYSEMFLLSAAHGILRSRSGFSELAQGIGRIPTAFRIITDPVGLGYQDECFDFSLHAFQTMLENGFHVGVSDAAILEYPQVLTDVPIGE